MAEIGTQPIFGSSGHPWTSNFCLSKKLRFSPTRSPAPPFIFFDNGLTKKKKFFLFKVWTYVFGKHTTEVMLLCYLAQNGKKFTTEISPKWDFYKKQILVTFYCCFFRFFSKNCQKVKVTNLTKNGQNYQIMLETCFLNFEVFRHHLINILP